jgi:hypothetical protein
MRTWTRDPRGRCEGVHILSFGCDRFHFLRRPQ